MEATVPAVCFLLSSGLSAQNAVTDWATIVQPAINTPPKSPAIQLVLRATVQLAVYDAAIAISPWLPALRWNHSGSTRREHRRSRGDGSVSNSQVKANHEF